MYTQQIMQKMAQLKAAYPELATVEGRDAFFADRLKATEHTTAEQEDSIMQTAIAETQTHRQAP